LKTWARLSIEERAILEEGRMIWEQAMQTEITKAEATGAKFGAENGISFTDFDAGEQVSLDELYNKHGLAEAGRVRSLGGDATPIYQRFQAVIAGINAGSGPICAKTGDAS
jgi:hypothetical protein